MSGPDAGQARVERSAFPSCEICGAVVRRQSMRLHHAWHDDIACSTRRQLDSVAAQAQTNHGTSDEARDI